MATGSVAKDSSDIAWLILGSMGVVVLTLVGHAFYKDLKKILSAAEGLAKPRRERRQKKRIMNLLSRCSDEELARISYALAAWSRAGIPDNELSIARPPHYRWDLKSGLGERDDESDPLLSVDELKSNTREDLLSSLETKLTNRSRFTLTWLEQQLAQVATRTRA